MVTIKALTIQPNDLLSIQVYSNTLNQEQVAVFNMANNGGMSSTGSANQQLAASISGYLVDQNGYIEFPMLGRMKVAELSRAILSKKIEDSLSQKYLVKDPIVQVRFLQLKISILGEVKSPGSKTFTTDRITLLDALSAAGDLTDRGRRDNIKIIREENGLQRVIPINLLDASFMSGEGFQIQQNDVVYVNANDYKLKETKFDPKTTRDLQMWTSFTSLFSFAISLFLLFKK